MQQLKKKPSQVLSRAFLFPRAVTRHLTTNLGPPFATPGATGSGLAAIGIRNFFAYVAGDVTRPAQLPPPHRVARVAVPLNDVGARKAGELGKPCVVLTGWPLAPQEEGPKQFHLLVCLAKTAGGRQQGP